MKNITLLLFLLVFNLNAQVSGKLIPDGSIPTAKIIGGVGDIQSRNDVYTLTNNLSLHKSWFSSYNEDGSTSSFPSSLDGLIVKGDINTDSFLRLPSQDMSNCKIDMPVVFQGGRSGNFKIYDNDFIGYLQFGTEDTMSNGKTLIFIGGSLTTSAIYCPSFDYSALRDNNTNSGQDYTLYFKDFTFNLTDVASTRAINLNISGSVTFENTTFNITANAIDVTGSTCGTIIFKDCPNLPSTMTLRAGDKILYTYPNVNCPTYASNALAVAALGVGYYYKDSADSNKFKITY